MLHLWTFAYAVGLRDVPDGGSKFKQTLHVCMNEIRIITESKRRLHCRVGGKVNLNDWTSIVRTALLKVEFALARFRR